MKVEITETFYFQPESLFAIFTNIPHHMDWVVTSPDIFCWKTLVVRK